MKTIRSYIDEAVQAGRIKNAAQLSVILNVKEATVSRWKSGDRVPNDEEAVKLAEAIGKEAGELLAECGAARAKTPETRQAWERIAARMASSITLCLMLMPFGHSNEAQASTASESYCYQKLEKPYQCGDSLALHCLQVLTIPRSAPWPSATGQKPECAGPA